MFQHWLTFDNCMTHYYFLYRWGQHFQLNYDPSSVVRCIQISEVFICEKKKHLRTKAIQWVASRTLWKKQSGFKVCAEQRTRAWEGESPGWAEVCSRKTRDPGSDPTPWWPRWGRSHLPAAWSLSRGHPLTGQGTVMCNWLMSGGHFEDEKCQVGLITATS